MEGVVLFIYLENKQKNSVCANDVIFLRSVRITTS